MLLLDVNTKHHIIYTSILTYYASSHKIALYYIQFQILSYMNIQLSYKLPNIQLLFCVLSFILLDFAQ